MVRTLVKYFIGSTYKPLLVKYLSKNRRYTSHGIHLEIPPEVFHPGFFFSTKLLLRFVSKLPLQDRTLLELGAGSGLIAMYAAKHGAIVTASDINPVAIEYLHRNKQRNQSSIRIVHADLFDNIPREPFDIIAINPPYYKKNPHAPGDYAWYCGEKGEYFERLFNDLDDYMHGGSVVLMILCDGCDLDMIRNMANTKGFKMFCTHESRNIVEKNYIFTIEKN